MSKKEVGELIGGVLYYIAGPIKSSKRPIYGPRAIAEYAFPPPRPTAAPPLNTAVSPSTVVKLPTVRNYLSLNHVKSNSKAR